MAGALYIIMMDFLVTGIPPGTKKYYYLAKDSECAVPDRNYPCPPHGRSLGILREWGISIAKNCTGKYEAKLKFLEGWGVSKQKNLP